MGASIFTLAGLAAALAASIRYKSLNTRAELFALTLGLEQEEKYCDALGDVYAALHDGLFPQVTTRR